MKILHVNKFFWQSGGVERYMFEVSDCLNKRGHETIFFSMQHPNNFESAQSEYFVSNIAYRDTSAVYKARTLFRTVGKTVYSFESRRKMEALLEAERPDIAHIHLISHQISPSILLALRKFNVPTVQTVHEYKRICPAAQLYVHHRDEICERCLHGNYVHAVLNRCVQRSVPASALASLAQYAHRYTGIYEDNIDCFIAPSRFMAGKLAEGGVSPDKIRALPYTLDLEKYAPDYTPGDYVVFFGRLSREKGIRVLLDAMRQLPSTRLLIVGEGPQRAELEAIAVSAALNVDFLGHLDGDALRAVVREAAVAVLPSQWYDNLPMVVFEAFALGTPIVASRIGGIPEIVDADTGILVEPRDPNALADALQQLLASPGRRAEMGRRGRSKIEKICAAHDAGLMDIYAGAQSRH